MDEINDIQGNYTTGYIKVFRSLKNKGWYKKSEYVHLWLHLLIKSTHKGIEFFFNGENIVLNPGQFITGRKTLSEETGINESKIERILNFFEKNEHQIEQQKTNKSRLISILNWEEYQQSEQQNEQQLNNKRTTTEQQLNTNKNVKNINNDNNAKNVKNIILLSQVDESTLDQKEKHYYQITISFFELFKSNLIELNISTSSLEKARYDKWINPIRLLMESDKRTLEEIREVFTFLKNDDFWKEQIRSTEKLRKKNKDGITYFESLLIKSRNGQKRQQNSGKTNNSNISPDYLQSISDRLHGVKSSEKMPGN